MKKFKLPLILAVSILLALAGCKGKNQEVAMPAMPENAPKTELPVIKVKRYEKELFRLDRRNLRAGLEKMAPDFSFFLGSDWRDTTNLIRIANFISDPNIRELYDLTLKQYPDTEFLVSGLGDAFARYRNAYPDVRIPTVYTYVSGLDVDHPVYYSDTAIAIGLDLFLGSDAAVYPKAGLPRYKTLRFTKDHLLPFCMLAVSDRIIRVDESQNTLLDQMVTAGKELYFLDVTLPGIRDEFKIGYSPEQLDWSRKHEGDIWAFIIGKQLLFSSDPRGITKMMTDAPTTAGFEKESPGRLGAYLGWMIVRAYMQEAGSVTLKQLMENTDAREILKVSKYKPGKI
jgi:hypothetical protein